MLDEPKYWVSLISGLIVIALGGIPLLNSWGLLGFSLPIVIGSPILLWVVAVVGAYLLIDTFLSEDDTIMWISAGVAFVILAIAIIQILNGMGIIGFGIPFITQTVLNVLFVIEGIGLLVAGFGDK